MRWLDVKYGTKDDRRMWLKLHLMCGVKTNVVTSVEISDAYSHDYHHFKPLVDHTANQGFELREVSADKGYLGTHTAQINEALCKVLCHNLCVVIQSVHELGIETNFAVEASLTA